MEHIIFVDVVVIGSGLAGIVAAMEAASRGADVALVSRGATGFGNNSAISNGVFAGPTSTYPVEDYIRDTLAIGKTLNDVSYVKLVAENTRDSMAWLKACGVDIHEREDHYRIIPDRSDEIPGKCLMKILAQRVKSLNGIRLYSGVYLKDILKNDEDHAVGAFGFTRRGEAMMFCAPSVVLAAGGGGGVYERSDNHKAIMGHSYALAARAGLPLHDMELVQFYPVALAEPGLPTFMLAPPHPPQTRIINGRGEDILVKYNILPINKAIRTMRDQLSVVIVEESNATGDVFIDYTRVPPAMWDEHPLSILRHFKFDFERRPARVLPVAHFFMGGVSVDKKMMTEIPGLFACGEVVWGLHGANRRGGNALTECVVSGRFAGQGAAQWALSHGEMKTRNGLNMATGTLKEASCNIKRGNDHDLKMVKQKLRNIAWHYAGVRKNETALLEGRNRLKNLVTEAKILEPRKPDEFYIKYDIEAGILTLQAIIEGSLLRKESVGAFIRVDLPNPPVEQSSFHTKLLYDGENSQLLSI